MIAAASLAFPGSKTLATWWSQLAPWQPVQLWVGHLFIHRLEALADVVQPETVDPLHRVLLKAIDQECRCEENDSAGATLPVHVFLERLDERLHLSPGLIARLIADLRGQGLLAPAALPALSDTGRQAMTSGSFPRAIRQRRELTFVERLRPDGSRLLPPHFLALTGGLGGLGEPGGQGQRWQPDADAGFDLALLEQSARQPQGWRDTFAFPEDISGMAELSGLGADLWQAVAIDRPERLLAAAVAVGPGPAKIQFFAARQDGWELHSERAIGTLSWAGRQEFPELAEPPTWAKAWQSWCQTRRLPQEETGACTLSPSGHRLDVHVPPALHARLVAAKNEVLKGDMWLLAGDGYLRSAVNLHVQAS